MSFSRHRHCFNYKVNTRSLFKNKKEQYRITYRKKSKFSFLAIPISASQCLSPELTTAYKFCAPFWNFSISIYVYIYYLRTLLGLLYIFIKSIFLIDDLMLFYMIVTTNS